MRCILQERLFFLTTPLPCLLALVTSYFIPEFQNNQYKAWIDMGNEELRNLITTVKLGAFPSPSFHETIGLKEQTHAYCFPLGKPFKYLVLVRVINQKKYFLNTPD